MFLDKKNYICGLGKGLKGLYSDIYRPTVHAFNTCFFIHKIRDVVIKSNQIKYEE